MNEIAIGGEIVKAYEKAMAQQTISDNIQARGYYEGHEPMALLARHIAKLVEEVAELSREVDDTLYPVNGELETFFGYARMAGYHGRLAFDDKQEWIVSELPDIEAAKKELADCLVVIMSMAQVINDNFGEFDVIQAALEKSSKDIERGVR